MVFSNLRESKPMTSAFQIDGGMTIYQASERKTQLMEALHASTELDIDLANVGEMDSSGLQLLILVKREAQSLGKQVRFLGHSKAVVDVLLLANLIPSFGDPVLILKSEGL
jgi:anti-anti-sigma factor